MKINNEIIKKIYNESDNLKLKNEKDKIKLSEYEEVIPMYDIFSDKIYPVKKENIYYRLIYCHYRFINNEVKNWIFNKYKKNKSDNQYNVDIINNYIIDKLLETSYKILYKFSPELGLSISICKRNSFNKYSNHLKPYYSKNELLKLGLNMKVINDNNTIDINNEETHYKICKKISNNDISSEEINKHNQFIIENNLIALVTNYSILGSYFMNNYLRETKNGSSLIIDSINKLGENTLNTPNLDNDYYLYRFIWDDFFLTNLKTGDKFIDKGFISTTRDPFYSPALKYKFGLILIKIKIPKKKNIGLLIENFSLFPKEEEFILPPHSELKLLSKDDKFKYYHTNEEFENIITKKYEFEYLDSKFKKINFKENEYYQELEFDNNGYDNKINIIKKFIDTFKTSENLINIKFNNRNYKIFFNWFDGTDSYSKYYSNENRNGMFFSVYDENFYPYLNIEFGDEMVVNFLNKFFLCNIPSKLDDVDIEFIFKIGNLFCYNQIKLFLEFDNFSKFDKENTYTYTKLYCDSIYQYLKNNKKFYSNLKVVTNNSTFEFGYWKLNKLKNTKIPNKIYERYKTLIKNKDTISDLIIKIIEEHYYDYPKLIELLDTHTDISPFDDLFLKLNIESFYEHLSFKDIPYDNNVKLDSNYNLIFRTPIRRIV